MAHAPLVHVCSSDLNSDIQLVSFFSFFFNDTATTEIYTLSLHDALPILLTMCYRYIFVLVRLFRDFLLARKSRVIAKVSWKDNLRFLARTTGIMLIRSLKLAEEVYLAMIARGFDEEISLPARRPLRSVDYGWIAFTFVMIGTLAWKG